MSRRTNFERLGTSRRQRASCQYFLRRHYGCADHVFAAPACEVPLGFFSRFRWKMESCLAQFLPFPIPFFAHGV